MVVVTEFLPLPKPTMSGTLPHPGVHNFSLSLGRIAMPRHVEFINDSVETDSYHALVHNTVCGEERVSG